MGPGSCTAEIKFTNGFTLDGRKVTLTDIPGFDDTTKSDAEILNIIAAYLAHTYVHIDVRHFWIFSTDSSPDMREVLGFPGLSTSTAS